MRTREKTTSHIAIIMVVGDSVLGRMEAAHPSHDPKQVLSNHATYSEYLRRGANLVRSHAA